MLKKSNINVELTRKLFKDAGLDAEFLSPTPTGLEKDYMDSLTAHRGFLKEKNIHDYGKQGSGQQSKVFIDINVHWKNYFEQTQAALFKTSRGDRRIRITGLKSRYAEKHDLIAFIETNGMLEIVNCSNTDLNAFLHQKNVSNSLAKISSSKNPKPPKGKRSPKSNYSKSKNYNRDPEVEAWVLMQSKGSCESCGKPSPFIRKKDSTFYLEIHHVKRLADGGSDTHTNAIALCPNCHREFHYGEKRVNLESKIYKKVSRLIKE